MLKKAGLGLICAIACFNTTSYAMPTHVLQNGITMEYDFPYNEPQQFVNYLFWAVQANCVLTSVDEDIDLDIEILAKKVTVNEISYSAGNSLTMNMHSGETLKLNVEAGAKAKITNTHKNLVHSVCTSK